MHSISRVLRRYRGHDVGANELIAMELAREAGYPVPECLMVEGPEMVLKRLHGPTMHAALESGSIDPQEAGALLASLHERLHAIPAPRSLPAPFGEGEPLLHLDLHPRNVLLTERGPVVIDWANAGRGPALADVAVSSMIFATALTAMDRDVRLAASAFVAAFLERFDAVGVAALRGAAARYRLEHADLTEAERQTVGQWLE